MEVEEKKEAIVKKEEEEKKKRPDDSDSEDDDDLDKNGKSKSQKALRALKKNKQGAGLANKIPTIYPSTKCKLRLLQLQRVYDFLQMETEYVRNKSEAKKVDGGPDENELTIESIRGSPLNICTVDEIIDEDHVIISIRGVLQYLVGVASFVDRDLLEPNCSVLVNPISSFVVGIVPKNTSSSVDVMRVEKAPEETYADIGGLDEQIMEIKEAVELPLTHPELFDEIGVKPPKGVILYGEPGTGKTLLAKAVANKTSATFLRLVGSELIQKYAGEGPKLVRDIFSTAKDLAPSIVFIDEIDSIGTKRYDADSSGAREVQRTMLELLNQLDGFDDRGDVKVIMATNRIDTLDPALLRPGRIDRKIKFPLPDTEAKRRIFGIHTSKMSLDADVNLDAFIEAKDDLSGADIRSICMEAGMMALKERRMKVNMADFEEAKKKTLFRKKSKEPEGLYL
ncbi:hypothetical protein WA588_005205 [Blastocystis sp. NMH]